MLLHPSAMILWCSYSGVWWRCVIDLLGSSLFVCLFFLSSRCVRVSFEGAVQSKTTIVPLIIRDCGEATQVGRCQSSEHRINFHRSIEKHSNTESLLSFWTTCLIVWRNLLICRPMRLTFLCVPYNFFWIELSPLRNLLFSFILLFLFLYVSTWSLVENICRAARLAQSDPQFTSHTLPLHVGLVSDPHKHQSCDWLRPWAPPPP